MMFLCRRDQILIRVAMTKESLSFDSLLQVVAELLGEVSSMKALLLQSLHNGQNQQKKENTHRLMSVEEAAEYLRMPKNTLYMKLQSGEVPASKLGKCWKIYQDELDKWLEVNRKNPIPLTDAEINEGIRRSNRRKPKAKDWMEDASASDGCTANDGTNPNNGEA